ncbi:hypothetical protein [Pseudanabaena mucicola]|jgi:hypothetical protein|nr:hypothetical protein [Pseudanabaena mucicola]
MLVELNDAQSLGSIVVDKQTKIDFLTALCAVTNPREMLEIITL